MGVDVKYCEELNYVEIIYNGNVAKDDLIAAFETSFETATKNNTQRYLADCTNLTGGHSVFDLYSLIGLFQQYKVQHTIREAIILPELDKMKENVAFYETAAENRGYIVKLFRTKYEALLWLSK